MNTSTINTILHSNIVTRNSYIGCFAADRIPTISKFPASFVLNLDKAEDDGSHWVALYVNSADSADYFDSFGLTPSGTIAKYLNSFKHIRRNNNLIQQIDSRCCGHYCIFFIYSHSLGISFDCILKLLQISDPDFFVRKFVSNFVK